MNRGERIQKAVLTNLALTQIQEMLRLSSLPVSVGASAAVYVELLCFRTPMSAPALCLASRGFGIASWNLLVLLLGSMLSLELMRPFSLVTQRHSKAFFSSLVFTFSYFEGIDGCNARWSVSWNKRISPVAA